ncbi:MAG TPA: nitrite/sulfite reductase [Nitrososphaeraceae archaeon]|nr:nitrite/sulfite reductase [Nitrososphaeraceae archaeon]
MKKNEELTKINHEQGSFVKPKENWGLEKETNNFANKVKLYRQGKLADDDFRRFRLQHGAYGSRLRPDYSMIRIKVPSGEITPEQLEKIATLSEAFSIGSAHVSTRQNIQLHWVQLEDVSEVMRGLVEVGLTTREACGNTVRNVMCSHFAGVCPNEVFDATPYSTAIAKFLLRNPMSQNLPRKFKINFGCCNKHGLVRIADIGLVPDLRDGKKGFRIYLGGGLGAASFIGHLLEDFTSEEQLLSTCMATIRLFDRLGNRDNMARNRMRYLVNEIGWEKFQKMVLKERAIVGMTVSEFTKNLYQVNFDDSYVPLKKSTKYNNLPIVETNISTTSNGYDRWLHTNVVPQKQENYFTIFITLGAGDITSSQLRSLALLIRKFSSESIARNTPQQNFAIRYIYNNDLPAVYKKLMAIGLANPGALTITSAVGCSGTTSCNLAITNSHRLAKEVQRTLLELGFDVDNDLRNSTIKISGCPNSCGQHEIATIGFFGGAARIENSMAPVYTMLFGGNGYEDEGKLGKAIMRVPAKRVIDVIKKIVELYKNEKSSSETLDMWIDRIINNNGNGNIKNMDDIKTLLTPVTQLPPFEEDQELYQDYGNDIKFVAKTARGECAA